MILVPVFFELCCKPSAAGRVGYCLFELISRNSNFDWPVRDCVLQDGRVRPIDCGVWAVVIRTTILLESLAYHRVKHVGKVGAIENLVLLRPLLNLRVGNKNLRLMTGLGEGLLCCNAISVLVIKPKRKLVRLVNDMRRSGAGNYVRCCSCKLVSWRWECSTKQFDGHGVLLLLSKSG